MKLKRNVSRYTNSCPNYYEFDVLRATVALVLSRRNFFGAAQKVVDLFEDVRNLASWNFYNNLRFFLAHLIEIFKSVNFMVYNVSW